VCVDTKGLGVLGQGDVKLFTIHVLNYAIKNCRIFLAKINGLICTGGLDGGV